VSSQAAGSERVYADDSQPPAGQMSNGVRGDLAQCAQAGLG